MPPKPLTDTQKHALTALRQRMGGISDAKKQHTRALNAARQAIRQALAQQPATVPAVAQAIHRPTHEVLWHLTGMRKYGQIQEAGEEEGYVLYTLTPASASQN